MNLQLAALIDVRAADPGIVSAPCSPIDRQTRPPPPFNSSSNYRVLPLPPLHGMRRREAETAKIAAARQEEQLFESCREFIGTLSALPAFLMSAPPGVAEILAIRTFLRFNHRPEAV